MENNNSLPVTRENFVTDTNSRDKARENSVFSHTIRSDRGFRGVRSVNITSDNRFLIISYEIGTPRIRVADLERLEFLPYEYAGHNASVRLTCITLDNKAFHTASWDGSSRRFELHTGKVTRVFSGFGRSPSVFLDERQGILFTASYDQDIDLDSKNACRCWDLATGKILGIYKHFNNRLYPEAIDVVYENGLLYSGSDDGCVYHWRLNKYEPERTYFRSAGAVRKLALSGKFIAAACDDFRVHVHLKSSGECYRIFMHNEQDVREVRISGDETRLWSATDNGTVYCFSLVTGELIYSRRVHPLWIWSLALMNNESVLITGSGDGSVAFLSSSTGHELARLYNYFRKTDFMIASPPDKAFPSGFFYATNKELIQVILQDREHHCIEFPGADDPESETYFASHNLKNLIISRLKNEQHYNSLTNNYMQRIKLLEKVNENRVPRSLKA